MNTSLYSILRLIVLLCIGLLYSVLSVSADWSSFIINYNKNLYGKGSQTWQINAYDESWIYFANQSGMLQYDGNSWSVFPLNNGSDVRSILPSTSQKRIYAGGISEFGYFEPDRNGHLTYVCLSDSIPEEERAIGNIWGIHEADNILYIQGDNRIVKYLNGKFTFLDAQCKIDCSYMVKGVLYVGTDKGVMVLIGNTFFPLRGADSLQTKRIRGIIPHTSSGVIVVTAYDGLFHCDGDLCVPIKTGVEDFLSDNEIFCVAASGDLIALGTVHRGIVLFNHSTLEVKHFNENNGLQNNTVLSLAFDSYGSLWAGLDNGIDYVCLNSPLTNLYTYPYSYGTGYDALLDGRYLFLATNRGLYYTKYPIELNADRPDIQPIPHSSGQVWGLRKIGDQIFCMHDRGLFLIEGLSLKRVGQLTGVWTCQPVVGTEDKMYVGVYDGLYLLQKEDGQWTVKHRITGATVSFRFFEQESERILWMSDQNRCIRVELDPTLTRVSKQTLFDSEDGLPSDKSLRINKISGKVYFSASSGIYEYNHSTNRMEYSENINDRLNGSGPFYFLKEYNDHILGLNQREVCISNLVTYKRGASTHVLPLDMPAIELVRGAETLISLSDSLVIIPNDNGFALGRLWEKQRKDYSKAVHIRNVFISYPKDSLIYKDNFRGDKDQPRVPYTQNAVRIEYGITSFTHGEEVSYQYRLDNDNWSDATKSMVKEYSNLPEGEHTFQVKAVFSDAMSATDSFTFQVLPPWYRTPLANVCYLLLVALLIWYIYKWDVVRVNRKKQQAVIEKDKELQEKQKEFEKENARKEQQIIHLEKEKLEHDLRYKSQEMANLMINFVRKNEILTEIKSDLFKVMSVAKNNNGKDIKQHLLIVSNKIDSNIKSDDVLKRIEEQFDLVHNNFMKRLQEKHSDLSLNERMMCAYIKMNLSSKEIAPLLNISVRGVETVRYRIRKKLLLDREDSLSDYLNSNF